MKHMKMCSGKTVILTYLKKKVFGDSMLAVYYRNNAIQGVIMRKPIAYIHGILAHKVTDKNHGA